MIMNKIKLLINYIKMYYVIKANKFLKNKKYLKNVNRYF